MEIYSLDGVAVGTVADGTAVATAEFVVVGGVGVVGAGVNVAFIILGVAVSAVDVGGAAMDTAFVLVGVAVGAVAVVDAATDVAFVVVGGAVGAVAVGVIADGAVAVGDSYAAVVNAAFVIVGVAVGAVGAGAAAEDALYYLGGEMMLQFPDHASVVED